MLYLLWGLLNIGFLLFFVVTCFRAAKLVKIKFGPGAAIVFVFGLLSLIGNANIDKDNKELGSSQIHNLGFTPKDSVNKNTNYFVYVELEKTPISTYMLRIEYGKEKQQNLNTPTSAYSFINGLVSGTNWKPSSIIVNKTSDNNKFEYEVYGTVEWQLFRSIVYYQPKEYNGIVLLK